MSRVVRHAAGAVTALAALVIVLALGAARPAPAAAAAPTVRAPAGILVEPATGDVVWSRSARERRSIASTTKLMTALLTLERMRLGQTVTATRYRGLAVESVIGLRAGERLTVADLLRGLLLASANDAAATLAARVAGSRTAFVRLMNRRARELGLRDTHYSNPIGLDGAGNYSSAEDLVKLTLILRRNEFFRRVTNLPRATLDSGSRVRTIVNRNVLVRNVPAVNGVKTGHTSRAGYVLVGSASRDGVTVISAVLGDPTEAARDSDSLALLRYGLGRYRRVDRGAPGRALRQRDAALPRRAGRPRRHAHGAAHDAPRPARDHARARRPPRARRPAARGGARRHDRGPLARAPGRPGRARHLPRGRRGVAAAAPGRRHRPDAARGARRGPRTR